MKKLNMSKETRESVEADLILMGKRDAAFKEFGKAVYRYMECEEIVPLVVMHDAFTNCQDKLSKLNTGGKNELR